MFVVVSCLFLDVLIHFESNGLVFVSLIVVNLFLLIYFSSDFVFTDKMCDQISDAVLDAYLSQDPDSKVACGEFCTAVVIVLMCQVFRSGLK